MNNELISHNLNIIITVIIVLSSFGFSLLLSSYTKHNLISKFKKTKEVFEKIRKEKKVDLKLGIVFLTVSVIAYFFLFNYVSKIELFRFYQLEHIEDGVVYFNYQDPKRVDDGFLMLLDDGEKVMPFFFNDLDTAVIKEYKYFKIINNHIYKSSRKEFKFDPSRMILPPDER